MHELPVTENILEIALRHGAKARATRITDLYLVIGQLSSIVDDSIQFYWDIISAGTIAEGATLHFHRIPAKMHCMDCDHRYQLHEDRFACPQCDGERVRVVAGEEFFVEAIDIDKEPTHSPE